MKISVVVPTYNRSSSVERLLRALVDQTISPADYEVIVSIDGSQDDTESMIEGFVAPYQLRFTSGPNRGRAAACNAGCRSARGDIVLILDDDMEPLPECLEAHLRAHEKGSRLGVIGAVPIPIDECATPAARYIAAKFNNHLRKLENPDYRLHFRDFYSGNFSISRNLLSEVNGFDDEFRIYGNEDLELSWRLRKAGVELQYAPRAAARQHYCKSFDELARDNIAKGRTAVLLVTKHPETLPLLRLSGYHEGRAALRCFRHLLTALTRVSPSVADWVIATMRVLERRRTRVFALLCPPVLDYLFWVGALSLAEHRTRNA